MPTKTPSRATTTRCVAPEHRARACKDYPSMRFGASRAPSTLARRVLRSTQAQIAPTGFVCVTVCTKHRAVDARASDDRARIARYARGKIIAHRVRRSRGAVVARARGDGARSVDGRGRKSKIRHGVCSVNALARARRRATPRRASTSADAMAANVARDDEGAPLLGGGARARVARVERAWNRGDAGLDRSGGWRPGRDGDAR